MKTISGFDPSWIAVGILVFAYVWYWVLQLFRFISKRWYISSWDGTKDSARFKKDGLWWGYNDRTHEWFFIYNGVICWQVQSYKPTFAVWGVTWPWEAFRLERIAKDFHPSDMYSLREDQLGKLPKKHPFRHELEEDLRNSVSQQIESARAGNSTIHQSSGKLA
jgi:hypothetical protein